MAPRIKSLAPSTGATGAPIYLYIDGDANTVKEVKYGSVTARFFVDQAGHIMSNAPKGFEVNTKVPVTVVGKDGSCSNSVEFTYFYDVSTPMGPISVPDFK